MESQYKDQTYFHKTEFLLKRTEDDEEIDYSLFQKINNVIYHELDSDDPNVIINALSYISNALDKNPETEAISFNVYEKILYLKNKFPENIIIEYFIIDIIQYISINPDKILEKYMYLPIKQVILDIISTTRESKVVYEGLNALVELTNEKIETLKLIDGENLFQVSLFVLSNIQENNSFYRQSDQLPNDVTANNIFYISVNLLANCLCFFSAPDKYISESTYYIKCLFNSDCFADKLHASRMILNISYFQSELAINEFSNDILKVIPTLNLGNIQISFVNNIFGIINNMVFKSDSFALTISGETKIFDIVPTDSWNSSTFSNFFKLEEIIFKRMKTCDQNEVIYHHALENIIRNTINIIHNGIKAGNSYDFKTKNLAISMICSLLQVGNYKIISSAFSDDLIKQELIPFFLQSIVCNKINQIETIAETLLMLCKLSPINENYNIIEQLFQNDAESLINDVNPEIISDPEISSLLDRISLYMNQIM